MTIWSSYHHGAWWIFDLYKFSSSSLVTIEYDPEKNQTDILNPFHVKNKHVKSILMYFFYCFNHRDKRVQINFSRQNVSVELKMKVQLIF